tara:strand:+ start:12653 stop:13627 length:975 start_codon:yes stop_codon:yes gene_type:complete
MENQEYSQQLFKDIVGHSYPIKLLAAALNKKHIAPAYLFTGAHGIGRKLTALRFLEGLNSNINGNVNIRRKLEKRNHPDLIWIEPTYVHQGKLISKSIAEKENSTKRSPPQIRLEQIKELKQFLGKNPLESEFIMIIIENLEMLNEPAANALLKTLEEPGKGVFLLITSRPESTLSTIKSRCQTIPFNRLSINSIEEIFRNKDLVLQQKKSIFQTEKELLNLSNGSPGEMIKNIQFWENIPDQLWSQVKKMPLNNPLDALSLAKNITDQLNNDEQIWLINWIQQYFWVNSMEIKNIKKLERLRSQIESFVQPRLSWEIALLSMM